MLPRRIPMKPSNMVTVEVIDNDRKHRMYRSFIVPVKINGDFKCLDEVLDWVLIWIEKHPGHICKLYFDPDIIAKHYREKLRRSDR